MILSLSMPFQFPLRAHSFPLPLHTPPRKPGSSHGQFRLWTLPSFNSNPFPHPNNSGRVPVLVTGNSWSIESVLCLKPRVFHVLLCSHLLLCAFSTRRFIRLPSPSVIWANYVFFTLGLSVCTGSLRVAPYQPP